MTTATDDITLRPPTPQDGAPLYRLISQCPPLDTNSMYCNLLQCTHFSETSVAAELNGELAGFISGYIKPSQPQTLFVWQVAVGEAARGKGLASQMLAHLVDRKRTQPVTHIETTITPDNQASWALFKAFANKRGANIADKVMFDREQHFQGEHATEHLVSIGPL